jgi:hypothetical protein
MERILTVPHYTITPTPTGRWAVCERVPGTNTLSAICDCSTQAQAEGVARDANHERERLAELQLYAPVPRWRHTQPGARARHAAAYARCRTLPDSNF